MATKNTNTKSVKISGQKKQEKPTLHEEGEIIQLIVFHMGDEEFSADIEQVRDIIWAGSITAIPDSPDFIKGVTNVRGEIAVVIDLKKRFNLRSNNGIEEKHIVMTEQDNNLFGLMVDEVTEVLRIPETDIRSTPEIVTRIDRAYLSGVLTIEDRLIMLLDLRKVLSEEELVKLSEMQLPQHTAEEIEPENKDQTVTADDTDRKPETGDRKPEMEEKTKEVKKQRSREVKKEEVVD